MIVFIRGRVPGGGEDRHLTFLRGFTAPGNGRERRERERGENGYGGACRSR